MNQSKITIIKEREKTNSGIHIYLYRRKEETLWVSYGFSAYALRLLVKRNGWESFRFFADKLQLPATLIDENVLALVRGVSEEEPTEDSSCLHLIAQEMFSVTDYNAWSDKVAKIKIAGYYDIVTPVSNLVPKDVYIADGMSAFSRNVKRMFDCFAAFVAMLVFSPLFFICYILIKREDGGNPIFKQERIGRFGRPFFIYKFRSMRLDAEKMGPQLSHAGGNADPRLTKIGKFIRAHHLDELPQLYNVFIGDMSFVGPRPERRYYIDQILEHDKRYEYLYQIRPGVTSPATLYNGYTDTMAKMLSRLEYDLYYLGHRSWWLDVTILFKTFCKIIFGKIF